MPLVISRTPGERLYFVVPPSEIMTVGFVEVHDIRGNRSRLFVNAPPQVSLLRAEIMDAEYKRQLKDSIREQRMRAHEVSALIDGKVGVAEGLAAAELDRYYKTLFDQYLEQPNK